MAEPVDALRACEERVRNLITRNVDAILVVDQHGVVRFVNPAGETLLGRPGTDLIGSEFGFPVLAGETTEVDVVGSDGAATVAEMRVVDTEWEGGPAFLAVLRDCTERKRAEEERAQLLREQVARAEAEQALRERDAFLAVASHELKTPLSTLSATAQLLQRQLGRQPVIEPDRLQTTLRRLDDQTRRLARLVSHLLDISDINAGSLVLARHEVDLRELIETVISERRPALNSHTVTLRASGPLAAAVDAPRLERLVGDLLDNAVQYSPDGGTIEVELGAEGPMAWLAVRDHGRGVPPERRARLFERVTPAQADDSVAGLGLGLFICRHVVEAHGGRMEAEFPPDGGSRFVVRLPLSATAGRTPAT